MSIDHKKRWGFDFFKISGAILLTWYILDLVMKIYLYNDNDYLWLCSYLMLYFAIGMFFKSPKMLLSGFAIAILIHITWGLDFLMITLIGKGFGTAANFTFGAAYTFGAGNRVIEFLNSTRHLVMLPLAWYGLIKLKKYPKKGWILIPALFLFTWISSYLFTNPTNNVNGVFDPYWAPGAALLPYVLTVLIGLPLAMVLAVASYFVCRALFTKIKHTKKSDSNHKKIFYIWTGLTIVLIILGLGRFLMQPRYNCEIFPNNFESEGVITRCVYIMEKDGSMTAEFLIENTEYKDKKCEIELYIEDNAKYKDSISLNSLEKKNEFFDIPFPSGYTQIKAVPICS